MNIADQTIKDFQHHFYSFRGFRAIPGNIIAENGKRKFSYSAFKNELTDREWNNHFKTAVGLTPSPIINGNQCTWGCIDDDKYKDDLKRKLFLITKAKELKLVPCESKSGGLHLYCFAKEEVQASNMRGYLQHCLEVLKLDTTTEVFPKQNEVKDGDYGNGITLPYRAYSIEPEQATKGLALLNSKIITINPEQLIRNIKLAELPTSHFLKYDFKHLKEDVDEVIGDEGSILDPEMQKLTATEIYNKIVKDEMSINNDSYFDDLVTLFVGKGVGSFSTDDEILKPLLLIQNSGVDKLYYQTKISRSRAKLMIEDPNKSRADLLKNCIYIKQRDKFFDLTTNEEYKKEAIDFTYARLFNKKTPSTFIKNNPKRIAVEEWIYDPQNYKKDKKLITQDDKLYLNSYEPSSLDAEEGDIDLWNKLLDHYFNDQMKYREHFLDWLAFQIQNPGVKIRHALILVSTQYQVGKGSMWRAIKQMFGNHNAKEIDVGQALDKSKGFLTNSQLVLIDEMQSAGKFDEKMKLLNDLKRIITEDHISSRALYIDYKIIKSCTNYLLFTNHVNALSLPNNEVRYWVYVSERARMNDTFYADYHLWLDNGGAKAILYSLKYRDISDSFNPKGIAPDTPYREQMTKDGEHPLTQIIRVMFEEYQYPFTEKQIIIGSMELYKVLQDQRILGRARINDVAKALEQIGGRALGQCRIKLGGKIMKPSLYLIRNQDQYAGRTPQELADQLYFPITPKDNDGII